MVFIYRKDIKIPQAIWIEKLMIFLSV